jgi:putative phosphoribosyl transferase
MNGTMVPAAGVRYASRQDAGRMLARALRPLVEPRDVVVLGLPCGGAAVAAEIAHALGAPWDVWLVQPLAAAADAEVMLGVVASGGIRTLDREVLQAAALPWDEVDALMRAAQEQVARADADFREGRRPLSVTQRHVVVVDDVAAGSVRLRAAAQSLRMLRPASLTIAVPAATEAALADLAVVADHVECPVVVPSPGALDGCYAAPEPTRGDLRALLGLPR